MPTDDEILEANRALTRVSRRLSTCLGGSLDDEAEADVVLVRRGLGITFEGVGAASAAKGREAETLRAFEGVASAIDGNIADLAGVVREVAAVLRAERHGYLWGEGSARSPGLTIEALDAGKCSPSKHAKRTRKKEVIAGRCGGGDDRS